MRRGQPQPPPPPLPPPVTVDPVIAQADALFAQANRSKSGFLSPGELLCQMIECGVEDPPTQFPAAFLCLDTNGDGKISKQECRDGYKRFARGDGVRAKEKVSDKEDVYTLDFKPSKKLLDALLALPPEE